MKKYDSVKTYEDLDRIREIYLATKLDSCFQRNGGVDGGSGWSLKKSRKYINCVLDQGVGNTIMIADVKRCLENAQRDEVLDPVIRALSIKYFSQLEKEGYEYVSIDGNNSASVISSFLNENDERIGDTRRGKIFLFKDKSKKERIKIAHRTYVEVMILRAIGVVEMCDLFRNINDSMKLNGQEHRQARWSNMSTFIREISNEESVKDLFANLTFSNPQVSFDKRTHEEMVAQFALKVHKDYGAIDLYSKHLNEFYENTDDLGPAREREIRTVLGAGADMAKAIGKLSNRATGKFKSIKKGILHALLDLIYVVTVKNKFKILDPEKFFEWFIDKHVEWEVKSGKVLEENWEEESYTRWLERFTHHLYYTKVKNQFEGAFYQAGPELEKKGVIKQKRTSADSFRWEDKLELLVLQKYKTRKGENITALNLYLGELEADHVKSVKEGGKTEISNGELMYQQDNRSKGSKSNEPHFDFQRTEARN